MSKYGSRKTTVDGITFHSAAEARYYQQLKIRKYAGDITDFELQPAFPLMPTFRKNGKTYRGIKYVADFKVTYPNGRIEIIDVKGMKTGEYGIKRKLFEHYYPDLTITEVAV